MPTFPAVGKNGPPEARSLRKRAIERKSPAGGNRRKNYWENMPPETKGEKTAGKGYHRGAKHKIPQKRIDISLIPAII